MKNGMLHGLWEKKKIPYKILPILLEETKNAELVDWYKKRGEDEHIHTKYP